MGVLDGLGGIGNLLGQVGLTQQQMYQQQMLQGMSQAANYSGLYNTTNTTVTSPIVWYDASHYSAVPDSPAKAKGPESALEWLDRRVSEMCVAL